MVAVAVAVAARSSSTPSSSIESEEEMVAVAVAVAVAVSGQVAASTLCHTRRLEGRPTPFAPACDGRGRYATQQAA
jgi:hypothetical protein